MSLTCIEFTSFCERHNIKHTTFGRKCNGDPTLIHDIAHGRQIGHALEARIRRFMAAIEAGTPEPIKAPMFQRATPAVRTRRAEADIFQDVAELIVVRGPCFNCGVRIDVHSEMGCRRWRAGE